MHEPHNTHHGVPIKYRKAIRSQNRERQIDFICHQPISHHTFAVRQTRALDLYDFIGVLLPDTRHLVDEASLRAMKRSAILVNAARGPIVDEAALARALGEGWIAGAGLDVFEEEPRIHPALIPLRNVVLAPHIASASFDTRLAMATLAVRNCVAVLEGNPPLTPVP